MVQEQGRTGLSLTFHTTQLNLVSGQYQVDVKVYGDYLLDPCVITIDDGSVAIINNDDDRSLAAKVNALASEFNANIYPNPNSGEEVRIALDGLNGDAAMGLVRFIDVTGKVVFQESVPVKGEQAQFLLNPAGLSAVIYSINIQVGSQFVTKSFVQE